MYTDYNVHRIFVDNESPVNILFYNTLFKYEYFFQMIRKVEHTSNGFLRELILW